MNSLRKIAIYIDGKKVGSISNGSTVTFEVAEGIHEVRAKIDWCGSPKVTCSIQEGENKNLYLSGFKGSKRTIRGIAIIIAGSILIGKLFYDEYFNWIITIYGLMCIACIAYILSIGRNKYLQLKLTG